VTHDDQLSTSAVIAGISALTRMARLCLIAAIRSSDMIG